MYSGRLVEISLLSSLYLFSSLSLKLSLLIFVSLSLSSCRSLFFSSGSLFTWCGVCVVCVVCVMCVVWCGTLKKKPCVDSKRPTCARSKRPRACWHHAHMLKHTCAWCRYTRRRFESRHGGRFERTHRPFPLLSHHTQSQTHHTHTNHNTNATSHGDREREREKEREDTLSQPNTHTTQPHTATHSNTTQHNTTQHNTTQHNTTQHNTTQHNTTQHNTTQHNTTQHNTLKPFPVRTCAVFYPFTSISGLSCPSVYNQFCGFPLGLQCLSLLSLLNLVHLRIMVLLMVPALISTEWVPAQFDAQFNELRDMLSPLGRGFADFDNNVRTISEAVGAVTSRITSVELTVNALVAKMAFLQQWNRTSAPSQKMTALSLHVYAKLKQMQLPALAAPARQALGIYMDKVMAPQPLSPSGPMARGLLTTTGTHDVDLIPSPTKRMNMHEVPFCFAFHVNNITLECLLGSKSSGQRPTHQLPASLPEYIAKEVPCQPDSHSEQEPNVRTLWRDTRMMVSPTKLIVHSAISVPISQSASASHLRIEKFEDALHLFGQFWPQNYKKSSQNEIPKIFSLSPHLTSVHKSSAFWIAGTKWENRFFKLAPP